MDNILNNYKKSMNTMKNLVKSNKCNNMTIEIYRQ